MPLISQGLVSLIENAEPPKSVQNLSLRVQSRHREALVKAPFNDEPKLVFDA
jgi:hypothetical protein